MEDYVRVMREVGSREDYVRIVRKVEWRTMSKS